MSCHSSDTNHWIASSFDAMLTCIHGLGYVCCLKHTVITPKLCSLHLHALLSPSHELMTRGVGTALNNCP